jgi:hypothetical protein
MAPNPRRTDERLEALYATLPTIDCQRHCYDSCGPIETSVRERQRIEQRAGPLTCGLGASCSMLRENRCGVYEIRPLICRLWGVVETMRCPYGCKPEPRYLTSEEGARLLIEADQIGGHPSRREERLYEQLFAAFGEDYVHHVAGELIRKTTRRPTLAGRGGSVPPTILDRPVEERDR